MAGLLTHTCYGLSLRPLTWFVSASIDFHLRMSNCYWQRCVWCDVTLCLIYIVNTVLCWQHFSRLVPAVPGGSVGHGCTYLDPNWVLRFRIKMIRNFFKLLKGYKTFGNYSQTSSNHIQNTIHATYKISYQTKNQKPRYNLINFL